LRGTAPSARRLAEATIAERAGESHDGRMQKNTKPKKLPLKTTTVRMLDVDKLDTVHGGRNKVTHETSCWIDC
jgi:hypothetical protein